MLAIKLKRIGKKGQAAFRVVVAEAKSKLKGESIEDLGWVNPHTDKFEINKERVNYWIKNGARATETVKRFIVKSGMGVQTAVAKRSK
jgi:small subunit ribosomal protein S16